MPPELRVRRLRPGDAGRLQAFVRGLSAHTRAERYFAPIRELSARQLDRLVCDHDPQNLVLAVTAGQRIVALGECFDGEFAVVVDDGWQGMGIGEALILAILAHAADIRLPLVQGLVRERNRPMLRLARRLGFRVADEVEPGLLRVEFGVRARIEIGVRARIEIGL